MNQDGLRELDEDPGGLQIIMKRRFEYRGLAAKPDTAGQYPIGTTAVYVVAHHRGPMVMVVQKQKDGWKVDPRWWIGMVDLASDRGPAPGTAAHSARALLAALIAMDRNETLRYAVPGANIEILFDGAPSEIPFVIRLVGKEWKVEPQPYFALINQ